MNETTENVIPLEEKEEKTLQGVVIEEKTPIHELKVFKPRKTDKSVKSVNTISKKNPVPLTSNTKEQENKLSFIITPHMDRWISTAVSLMSDNVSEISKASGVSRVAWYKWLKYPGFQEWYLTQYKAKRYLWIPKLDRMGMDRAPKSYDYWLAMNKKAGDLLEDTATKQPQQVVSILGGMTINNITKEKE